MPSLRLAAFSCLVVANFLLAATTLAFAESDAEDARLRPYLEVLKARRRRASAASCHGRSTSTTSVIFDDAVQASRRRTV